MKPDNSRSLHGRLRRQESSGKGPGEPKPDVLNDPFAEIKNVAQREAVHELGQALIDGEVPEEELREHVQKAVDVALAEAGTPLSSADRTRLVREITSNILGYGPIEPFLADESITEVMVNSHHTIYVERKGQIEETDVQFASERHLLQVIDRIVAQTGRRIDEASPMVDARLPDGSRVNAIIPPLAITGPSLTIRKFSKDPLTIDDLVSYGTLSHQAAAFLEACVSGKLNILVSGGTGTGKTTMLNVLSSFIPERERIVTIEDAAELRLSQKHVISLEARPANIEGKGQITIRDLVRNALRMRPDRIIVGECRGSEAVDMLQAMNTGHDGSLTTIHANSPRDALARTETLVLTAGFDLPLKAIRDQIASAFDLIIHTQRLVDGRRRITHITEVARVEGEVITLSDIFVAAFVDDQEGDQVSSKMRYTNIRPTFIEKLEQHGVTLPKSFFTSESGAKVDVLRRGQRKSA
ncbi:MAG: pilus assembly protein CpaF [Gaiellales bacterium]|jgi:pilus assembly protein CpaF|nr:pilus assembly protein CpaF [Gaiellales bacterium]